MRDGSVIVDVAIDQGRLLGRLAAPTTHEDPVFARRRDRPLLRRQHAGGGCRRPRPRRSPTRPCPTSCASPTVGVEAALETSAELAAGSQRDRRGRRPSGHRLDSGGGANVGGYHGFLVLWSPHEHYPENPPRPDRLRHSPGWASATWAIGGPLAEGGGGAQDDAESVGDDRVRARGGGRRLDRHRRRLRPRPRRDRDR